MIQLLKPRILLILLASMIALLWALLPDRRETGGDASFTPPTAKTASVALSPPTAHQRPKNRHIAAPKPQCSFPKFPVEFPLLDNNLGYFQSGNIAKEDPSLEEHLKRAKPNRSAKLERVQDYHLAGKILYRRAQYLLHYAKTGKKLPLTIPDRSTFSVPTDRFKAKAMGIENAKSAAALLKAVRPHPKYPLWSEALYLLARTLLITGRQGRAEHFLEIVGRTNSGARAAQFSRLLYGKLLTWSGNYVKAKRYLKKATLPPLLEHAKRWYLAAVRMGMENLSEPTALLEELFSFSAQKGQQYGLLSLLARRVVNQPEPLPLLQRLVSHLPQPLKGPFLAFAAHWTKKLQRPGHRALSTELCKLFTGVSP